MKLCLLQCADKFVDRNSVVIASGMGNMGFLGCGADSVLSHQGRFHHSPPVGTNNIYTHTHSVLGGGTRAPADTPMYVVGLPPPPHTPSHKSLIKQPINKKKGGRKPT